MSGWWWAAGTLLVIRIYATQRTRVVSIRGVKGDSNWVVTVDRRRRPWASDDRLVLMATHGYDGWDCFRVDTGARVSTGHAVSKAVWAAIRRASDAARAAEYASMYEPRPKYGGGS